MKSSFLASAKLAAVAQFLGRRPGAGLRGIAAEARSRLLSTVACDMLLSLMNVISPVHPSTHLVVL